MLSGNPAVRSSFSGTRTSSDSVGWKDSDIPRPRSQTLKLEMISQVDDDGPYPGLKRASAWVQRGVWQERQTGGEMTDLGEEDTCSGEECER